MHDKHFHPDELEHILAALAEEPRPKYRLFFLTLLHTGARCTEILNLKTRDLTPKAVRIYGLKGSNDRTIPLAANLLAELQKLRGPKLFNFSARYARMRFKRYLPPGSTKTIHSLRHTVGVRSYQKYKDIQLTRQLLGHRNIRNTQIYMDYDALLGAGDKIIGIFDDE